MVAKASRVGRGAADFLKTTRDKLALQAGNHCAFPGCKNPCFGPSQETAESVSNTGTACHIVAAADGPAARRVDPNMSDKDRRAAANGIWTCTYHSKLIDADDATYSVETLRAWKALAIRRAQLSQMLSRPASLCADDPDLNDLAPVGLEIRDFAQSRVALRDLFVESAAIVAWGHTLATATRDLVTEIVGNALGHGDASRARILVEPRRFVVLDDGCAFDCRELPNHERARGGAQAVRVVIERHAGQLLVEHRYGEEGNRTTISAIKSRADLMQATHCFVDADIVGRDCAASVAELNRVRDCEAVYILPPEGFTYSDRGDFLRATAKIRNLGKRPVLVMPGDTSEGVVRFVREFGDVEAISISDDESPFHRPEVVSLRKERKVEADRLRRGSGLDPYTRL